MSLLAFLFLCTCLAAGATVGGLAQKAVERIDPALVWGER